MKITDAQRKISIPQACQLLNLSEMALKAENLDQFAAIALPSIAGLMQSPSALLYVYDPHLAAPGFFRHGTWPQAASEVERWCAVHFERISRQSDLQPVLRPAPPKGGVSSELVLYPLRVKEGYRGLLGLATGDGTGPFPPEMLEKLLQLIAVAIQQLVERTRTRRQLAHLNAYLTVSSMLAQSQDLHEELEVALYCCMELVAVEAASVLLLDDEQRTFRFYQVEGPAKPVLATAVFPADRGLAGAVLQSQQAEIINDTAHDPRFYGKIDAKSGFHTRNMIVVPLTAGKERVGVLEVLNKVDRAGFTEKDLQLLLAISEEIAFAIRNAKVFEYVVSTYCKQRQGLTSCRGCQRPLGSWTPCVKYREANL